MSPEYARALLASRLLVGRLDVTLGRQIVREVFAWADAIARYLANQPADRRLALEATREVVYRSAVEMAGKLRRATLTNRDLAFEEILATWREAGLRIAARKDVPQALLGAIERPNLTVLAAFANRPGARTWASLLQGHVVDAAGEAEGVIRRGLLAGVSPPELAKRLRRYVQGSEGFQDAFRKVPAMQGEEWTLDLRTLPRAQRGQARQMVANATRIAVTETHAARLDAERLHFLADPLIAAGKWTLAPDRGTQGGRPDICDVMAESDQYGMGPGIFPLDQVPGILHPHDRCFVNPVERSVSEAGDPKPNPQRQVTADGVTIPRDHLLTPAARDRIRSELQGLHQFVDQSSEAIRQAMPTLAGSARAF